MALHLDRVARLHVLLDIGAPARAAVAESATLTPIPVRGNRTDDSRRPVGRANCRANRRLPALARASRRRACGSSSLVCVCAEGSCTGGARFIEEEFRGFLRCGLLAGGFARFRCSGCGLDRLVPFSCKGRAVCPSCGGRRMAERAAHLVDHVLCRAVAGVFVRAVLGSLRRRARRTGVKGGPKYRRRHERMHVHVEVQPAPNRWMIAIAPCRRRSSTMRRTHWVTAKRR
jgi:Transposase zinc-binding domain